jgi:hypothetical protein
MTAGTPRLLLNGRCPTAVGPLLAAACTAVIVTDADIADSFAPGIATMMVGILLIVVSIIR